MILAPTFPLYVALAGYALGTLAALASLFHRDKRLQFVGLIAMIGGFIAHTIWIGTICVNTGHPPIVGAAVVALMVSSETVREAMKVRRRFTVSMGHLPS